MSNCPLMYWAYCWRLAIAKILISFLTEWPTYLLILFYSEQLIGSKALSFKAQPRQGERKGVFWGRQSDYTLHLNFYGHFLISINLSNAKCHPMSPLHSTKTEVAFKSPLDQNPIVIYRKSTGDFKSYVNFGGTQGTWALHLALLLLTHICSQTCYKFHIQTLTDFNLLL